MADVVMADDSLAAAKRNEPGMSSSQDHSRVGESFRKGLAVQEEKTLVVASSSGLDRTSLVRLFSCLK